MHAISSFDSIVIFWNVTMCAVSSRHGPRVREELNEKIKQLSARSVVTGSSSARCFVLNNAYPLVMRLWNIPLFYLSIIPNRAQNRWPPSYNTPTTHDPLIEHDTHHYAPCSSLVKSILQNYSHDPRTKPVRLTRRQPSRFDFRRSAASRWSVWETFFIFIFFAIGGKTTLECKN